MRWLKCSPRYALFFCLFLVVTASEYCLGQQTAINEIGFKPYGAYNGGNIDSINLVNLKPTIAIPLLKYSQRGNRLQFGFNIVYHPPVFAPQDPVTCPEPPPYPTRQNCTALYQLSFQSALPNGALGPITIEPNFTYSSTYSKTQGTYSVEQGGGVAEHTFQRTNSGTALANDGTGLLLSSTGTSILDSQGTKYQMVNATNRQTGGDGTSVSDLNGNTITPTSDPAISSYTEPLVDSWTDSIGTTVLNPMAIYQCPPSICTKTSASYKLFSKLYTTDYSHCTGALPTTSAFYWNVPDADGGTVSYKICVASVPYATTNFCGANAPHCTEASGSITVIQSIVLPNFTAWTFNFDPNGGYADLLSIGLPTGGSVAYTWTDYTHCAPNQYGWYTHTRAIASRSLDAADGSGPHMWSYAQTYSEDYTSYLVTTITDPVPFQDVAVHTFTHLGGSCYLYETEVDQYQGAANSSNLLKKTTTSYSYTIDPNTSAGGVNALTAVYNVFPQTVTTAYNGSATSKVVTAYDSAVTGLDGQPLSYGTLLAKQEYDFGSGSSAGGVLKQTNYSYLWQSSNTGYKAANLITMPCLVTVYSSGTTPQQASCTAPAVQANQVAQTSYGYDEANGSVQGILGNQTSVTQWYSGGSSPKTQTIYNGNGMPSKDCAAIDPSCSNPTIYTYDSSGLFPSSIQRPTTNSVSHIDTFDYDDVTGELLKQKDENSQSTTWKYDDMRRTSSVTYPDGGTESYVYTDTSEPYFTYTKSIDANQSFVAIGQVDGLGRKIKVQTVSDPAGTDSVLTQYDALGRVESVSNPSRSITNTTDGATTYSYDALDRKILQLQPDNITSKATTNGTTTTTYSSAQQWSYSGNTATFTDENKNQWKRTTDALGRLTQVLEPNGTSTAPTMETDYTYDALDNLLSVKQCGAACPAAGSSNSVLRSFSYDSLSRLTSATNPESGSATYSYDANNNLTTKTSPAVNLLSGTQTLGYCYDALNRMTAKFYSAPTSCTTITGAAATYSYDSSSISGTTNTVGRLTDEKAYIGNTLVSERSPYSYDAMGRIQHEQQCPYSPACTAAYTFNYAYDLAGNLTSSNNGISSTSYPLSSLTFGFSYDGAGHMQSAGTTSQPSSWNGTASGTAYPTVLMQANQASSAAYDPMGHLINAQFGLPTASATPAFNLARQYDDRGRITLEMDDSITFYQIPTGGYAPNNNLLKINDTILGDWTYGYDTLNRVISGVSTSGPFSGDYGCWTYDAFGNRTLEALSNQTLTPCAAGANDNVLLTPLTPVAGTNRATNFTYDGAGNVQSDGNNAYEYDDEGRICEVATDLVGQISIYQYLYDAEGRRVAKGSTTSATCAAPTSANGFHLTNQYLLGQSGEQVTELAGTSGATPWHTNVWTSGGQLNTYDFANGGLHFSLHDAVGTKRIQISGSGIPELSCASLPFGNSPGNGRTAACIPWGSSNAPDATEQHFTGKERDAESGLDYFGARYYASSMGRFMSPDPGWFMEADLTNPQTWNLYSYALNNPLKLIDPNGMDQCIWDDGSSDDRPEDGGATQQECSDQGGNWASDTDTTVTVTPQSTDPKPSCSDFTGAAAPPSGPINYRQQAQANSQMGWGGWYQAFKGGGTQDFKGNTAFGNGDQQRAAGNFNFGASVAAKGWSLQTAQTLAGAGAYLSNVSGQVSWSMGQSAYMNGQYGGPLPPANNPPPPDWNVGPGSPGSPAYAPNSGLMNQGDQDASYENQSVALGYVWYSLGCTQ